jgi:diguanylate cyclase (GGDEF)-like protein
VPVALLVGILVASVVVNAALIVLVARADHFALRGPRIVQLLAELLRSDAPPRDEAPPRPRALYVAEPQPRPVLSAPQPLQVVPSPGAGRSASAGSRPLAETLPPDLAELLSRSAEIAAPSTGKARPLGGAGALVIGRWPRLPSTERFQRDVLTSLEGPASWSRILEVENARLLRYRRPVTIVMADIEGLQRLAGRMGNEPVQRLLPVVADALVREARSSDWIARLGEGRFAVLLPETDEIQAINYVERVRAVCEPWLASAAVQLRLAIGWSSPSASSDLEFAIRRAEERMNADRRTPGHGVGASKGQTSAFAGVASRAGDGRGRVTVAASAVAPARVEQPSSAGAERPTAGTEQAASAEAKRAAKGLSSGPTKAPGQARSRARRRSRATSEGD